MMQTFAAFSDQYFSALCQEGVTVTVFMMNGFQMNGTIIGHDQNAVLVLSDGKKSLIYKHAISTISPVIPIRRDGTARA